MTENRYMILTFRGFQVNLEDYIRTLKVPPSTFKHSGEISPSGAKIRKSFMSFRRPFDDHQIWDEAIPDFFNEIGGVEAINNINCDLSPEDITLTIRIPVRSSDEQEDRYISIETLRFLVSLNISIAFGFY